jgi:hypothetical protein
MMMTTNVSRIALAVVGAALVLVPGAAVVVQVLNGSFDFSTKTLILYAIFFVAGLTLMVPDRLTKLLKVIPLPGFLKRG